MSGQGEPAPVAGLWQRDAMRVVCVAVNASVDKVAAVDRLVPGEIHRPELLSVVPGGKAVNVARAAIRLGLEAVVVPVVAGHAGAWLVEALGTERIPTRAVRIAGETRTCLSILDRATGRLTEVYEPGPPIDARGWAELEAAVAAELETDGHRSVVVLSGSLLAGAPSDGYARIVALAHREHARSVVDADGVVLGEAIAARPWLVVNAEEPPGQQDSRRTAAQTLVAARALRTGGAGSRSSPAASTVRCWSTWTVKRGDRDRRRAGPYRSGAATRSSRVPAGIAGSSAASEAMRWAVAAGAANARAARERSTLST
jgi:fructose-1-phosphate kinase PfkB-like protein